jgi:molybdate transport system substrate-binding protein
LAEISSPAGNSLNKTAAFANLTPLYRQPINLERRIQLDNSHSMKCAYHIKKLALICATLSVHIGVAHADTTVFAAASLRGALDEIAALSDTPITLSYAGSGTIARQVAQGAPADVVILAHPRWMDWLETQNAILSNSRVDVAHNSLVVIGAKDAKPITDPSEINARLGQGRLAIGQRDAVPAGIYTQEWLAHVRQWDTLKSHLAEVENVRFALAFVARSETPLGVVYRSDAQAEPKVTVVYNVPADTHGKITYPAAATNADGHNFIYLLTTTKASHILESHGFTTPRVQQ